MGMMVVVGEEEDVDEETIWGKRKLSGRSMRGFNSFISSLGLVSYLVGIGFCSVCISVIQF